MAPRKLPPKLTNISDAHCAEQQVNERNAIPGYSDTTLNLNRRLAISGGIGPYVAESRKESGVCHISAGELADLTQLSALNLVNNPNPKRSSLKGSDLLWQPYADFLAKAGVVEPFKPRDVELENGTVAQRIPAQLLQRYIYNGAKQDLPSVPIPFRDDSQFRLSCGAANDAAFVEAVTNPKSKLRPIDGQDPEQVTPQGVAEKMQACHTTRNDDLQLGVALGLLRGKKAVEKPQADNPTIPLPPTTPTNKRADRAEAQQGR